MVQSSPDSPGRSISNASPASTTSATEATIKFLQELSNRGFWGTITIKLQHGDVVHVTREESIPAYWTCPHF